MKAISRNIGAAIARMGGLLDMASAGFMGSGEVFHSPGPSGPGEGTMRRIERERREYQERQARQSFPAEPQETRQQLRRMMIDFRRRQRQEARAAEIAERKLALRHVVASPDL